MSLNHCTVDLKVCLLGRQYCGKTSLVERYLNNRFTGNDRYQSTIGAAYGEKKIYCAEMGKYITLGLWDTAGGERYESMSRIYYRGAYAAIACYDVTDPKSWEKLKYWIQEVRLFEQDCKIFIAATKCDLLGGNMKNRTVDYHDTTDFAEDYRVVELFDVSSKTGENIENLFDAIINEYVSDPEVRFAEYDRGPIDQYCDRNDIWKKGRRKGSCC